MVFRLRLLWYVQQPELHVPIVQLQSKLIDIFLDLWVSKQQQSVDYFEPVSEVQAGDFRAPDWGWAGIAIK